MPIKGLSQIRRLPRLGIIRLGVKAKTTRGTEYPKMVDYFVCPDEVKKIYGEKPRQLDIVLPLSSIDNVFPQFYKQYGKTTGLKCKGDGETANRINQKGEFEEIECLGQKCPNYIKGDCKEVATLNFLLPKVRLDGVYQLHTSSYHSIIKINSSLDYIQSMFGRISMIPLKLVVEPTESYPNRKMKKTVYTLRISFNAQEVINSIKKREGLLVESRAYPQLESNPEKEEKKIELPSSDEKPYDVPFPKEEAERETTMVSVDDKTILCDICESALSDKEIEYCNSAKFVDKKGNLRYQFLCHSCQRELGYK